MTKYLSIAILITGFLVGNAYGDDIIVDVYFDDGSVLHNAKFKSHDRSDDKIRVKHENEFFNLNFRKLKSIEFVVEPRTPVKNIYDMGQPGTITIKIKTKTGIVLNEEKEYWDNGKIKRNLGITSHQTEQKYLLTWKRE